MAQKNKELIIAQMREKGLKITPQRLAIVEALAEIMDSHPGANTIY